MAVLGCSFERTVHSLDGLLAGLVESGLPDLVVGVEGGSSTGSEGSGRLLEDAGGLGGLLL